MKSSQIAPQPKKGKSPLTMDLASSRKQSRSETELSIPMGKLPDDLMAFMRRVVAYLKPDPKEVEMKANVNFLSTTFLNESINVGSLFSFLLSFFSA